MYLQYFLILPVGRQLRADLIQEGQKLKGEKQHKLTELQKNKEEAEKVKSEREAIKNQAEEAESKALEYYKELEEQYKKKVKFHLKLNSLMIKTKHVKCIWFSNLSVQNTC